MNINFHIDQLILHGFDRIDRHQVEAAVQNELSRLLREQGLPSALKQSMTMGNINAGEFRIGQGAGANSVGTQVAQTVFRVVGR